MEELIEDPVFEGLKQHCGQINSGGCGIYALAVARYLTDRGVNNLELIACCRGYEYTVKENICNNHHIIDNVPAHIVVKYGDHCFDVKGVYEHDVFIDMMEADAKECVTIDFHEHYLVKAINNTQHWNPSFERYSWVPIIEDNFKIQLNDIIA